MLWLEPLVEVETPEGRIAFGPVRAFDVASLFDAGFHEGKRPSARHRHVDRASLPRRSQQRLTFARCGITDPRSLEDYRALGGYKGLERAITLGAGRRPSRRSSSPACAAAAAQASRPASSGARSPPPRATQKYIVCNADEGDSGTFSDRMIMEGDPVRAHRGHDDRRHRRRRHQGLRLHPLGISARHPGDERRDQGRAQGRPARQERRRFALRLRHGSPHGRGRLCVRRGDLAARKPGGQARPRPRQAAAAGACRPVRQADRHQQCDVAGVRAGRSWPRAARSTRISAWAARAARCRSSSPATSNMAASSRSPSASRSATSINDFGGGTASGRPVARGAGRRSARRLCAAAPVRHAVRLRGLRRDRRA